MYKHIPLQKQPNIPHSHTSEGENSRFLSVNQALSSPLVTLYLNDKRVDCLTLF